MNEIKEWKDKLDKICENYMSENQIKEYLRNFAPIRDKNFWKNVEKYGYRGAIVKKIEELEVKNANS